MSKATHSYLRTHAISGKVLTFDLRAEQADLLQRAQRARSGRAAKTLVKEGPLRITLVALRKGVSLREHRVAGAVSLESLHGRLDLQAEGRQLGLRPGQLAALDAAVPHVATALTDCSILITMSME